MSVYRPPPLRGRGRARPREGNSPDISSPAQGTYSAGRDRHQWDQDYFPREERNSGLESHSYNGSKCLDERSSGRGVSLKVIETAIGGNIERNVGHQRTGSSQSPDLSGGTSKQESPYMEQKLSNTRPSARNRPRRPDVQVYVPRGRRSRGSKGVPCRTDRPSGSADPVQSFLQDDVHVVSQCVGSNELPLKNAVREPNTLDLGNNNPSDLKSYTCVQTEMQDTPMTKKLVSSNITNRDISEACCMPATSQDFRPVVLQDTHLLDSTGIDRTRPQSGEISPGSSTNVHAESSQYVEATCVAEKLYHGYDKADVEEEEEEYSSQYKNRSDHLNDREGRSERHDERDPKACIHEVFATAADDDGDEESECSRREESCNIVSYSETCDSMETTTGVQETKNVIRTYTDSSEIETDTAEEALGEIESKRNDTTENPDIQMVHQMVDDMPGEPCATDLNEALHPTCKVSDPNTAVGFLETHVHEEGIDDDSLDPLTKANAVESCTDNSMPDNQCEDLTRSTLSVSKDVDGQSEDTGEQLQSFPSVVQSDKGMMGEEHGHSDQKHDDLDEKPQKLQTKEEEMKTFDHISKEIENSDEIPIQDEMFDNKVEQDNETKEDLILETDDATEDHSEKIYDENYGDSKQQEHLRLEGDENSMTDTSTKPETMSSGEEDPDSDSWDAMFDDDGECLDPSAMQELTSIVGKVKIQKTKKIDYLTYQPKDKSADIDYSSYGHVIEIYEFPTEFVTRDLITAFQAYMSRGFDLKWVDDTHALGIFDSPIAAQDALSMIHPLLKVCSLQNASKQSKAKAKRCVEFLQPYKERPKTSASAARRLVAGALGIQTNVPRETREKERQLLKEAKAKKRQDRKNKEDIWEFGRCAMDEES